MWRSQFCKEGAATEKPLSFELPLSPCFRVTHIDKLLVISFLTNLSRSKQGTEMHCK